MLDAFDLRWELNLIYFLVMTLLLVLTSVASELMSKDTTRERCFMSQVFAGSFDRAVLFLILYSSLAAANGFSRN